VTIEVEAVPRDVYDVYDATRPFAVFGLHRHEHKVSVLHFTLQRNTEYHEPIRSKVSQVLGYGEGDL
jgi:pre-rRNA-processing protein TSR1